MTSYFVMPRATVITITQTYTMTHVVKSQRLGSGSCSSITLALRGARGLRDAGRARLPMTHSVWRMSSSHARAPLTDTSSVKSKSCRVGWVSGYHNFRSPALLNSSSLFMYTARLLTALCLVLFIISLTGTPRSLLDVTQPDRAE
jgi:hypothetical protein